MGWATWSFILFAFETGFGLSLTFVVYPELCPLVIQVNSLAWGRTERFECTQICSWLRNFLKKED